MAKSNSFFGLRRGSTKSLTFSVFNGKQVTKDRVESVKNPRSLSQMEQRMFMATSSAAYAAMKGIVDHSFEGVSYGLRSMSEFIRLNNKAIRDAAVSIDNPVFAFNPYRDRSLYGGEFIISSGTASPISIASIGASVPSENTIRVVFGDIDSEEDLTANSLYDKLGIAVGEMCTLCFIVKSNENNVGKFGFVRIKAKAGGNIKLTNGTYSEYFDVESNFTVNVYSTGAGAAIFHVTVPNVVEHADIEYCAIHSVKSNNSWLRSNAKMTLNGYTLTPTFEDAIATYPLGDSYILNGGAVE